MQELLSLDDDTTLLWVGYHPVWLIWGDERLRIDLRRYYMNGENTSLEKYRISGHLSRVADARGPDDVMEVMALAHLDEERKVVASVEGAVDRVFGRRMIFRFERANTPNRRWARWMIRRRRITPADHAERLNAGCQKLLAFGGRPIDPAEEAPLVRARIEALYRAAQHRPEYAPIATEALTQYATGGGGAFPPRRLALERLALLPERMCRARVLELMRHEDPVVRENAAFAVPRKKPIQDRADLNAELLKMLDDPAIEVATQAAGTLVDIVAGGSRLAAFKTLAQTIVADPGHRLHTELKNAVEWSSKNTLVQPGFHKRVGVPKGE